MIAIRPLMSRFLAAEDGAVTTDYVPIMAVVVALGLAVIGVVSVGMEDISNDMAQMMIDEDVEAGFASGTVEAAPEPEPEQTIVRIRARVPRVN